MQSKQESLFKMWQKGFTFRGGGSDMVCFFPLFKKHFTATWGSSSEVPIGGTFLMTIIPPPSKKKSHDDAVSETLWRKNGGCQNVTSQRSSLLPFPVVTIINIFYKDKKACCRHPWFISPFEFFWTKFHSIIEWNYISFIAIHPSTIHPSPFTACSKWMSANKWMSNQKQMRSSVSIKCCQDAI